MGEVNEFLKLHKGERVMVRFFVAPKGSSEALKGYYFNYVVPTVRRALYETGERSTEGQPKIRSLLLLLFHSGVVPN